MNIFKEITGQGQKVVILHGWGGCDHRHMQPIVNQLAARYEVMNFDLPGQGKSDWHPDIENINDIADQLLPSLPTQAIYMGWSFGGLVAISIAARYPERVKHLIGIGTTPKFVTNGDWPGIPQPGFKSTFVPEIKQNGLKAFIQTWYDSEFATIDGKSTVNRELIDLLDDISSRVNLNILFKGVDICDATDLRQEFKSIQCPIDLVFGKQDPSIPTTSFEKIKELNSKISIHVMPDAQHMPFWTNPNEFNKILNQIL